MNRREFLMTGAMAAVSGKVFGAEETKVVRVAVVGCGGRGTGGTWKPKTDQDYYKFGALGNMLAAMPLVAQTVTRR